MNNACKTLALAGLSTIVCAANTQPDTAGLFGPSQDFPIKEWITTAWHSRPVRRILTIQSHKTPHPTASSTAIVFGDSSRRENGGPYALNNPGSKRIRPLDDTLSRVAKVTGSYAPRLALSVAPSADLNTLSPDYESPLTAVPETSSMIRWA